MYFALGKEDDALRKQRKGATKLNCVSQFTRFQLFSQRKRSGDVYRIVTARHLEVFPVS
jgi:hypothetical protein